MFRKILIANRGEIACRVIRTARKMGVATVAVYSEADRDAAHVALADEAHLIGPAPARDSYLKSEAILAAARKAGAEAIHPGYGFLSENAAFAEDCAALGLVFIGPPANAIRAMGGKSAAKALMERAKVPVVPGYHGDAQDLATLAAAAERIGYPVLIKASSGGGGKGMRVVEAAGALEEAVASAKREAKSAFGDDRVLIEKYLQRPRHIEVQIFADRYGSVVHLFERDCSMQRRHQKVIEEAPAPGMTKALRFEMGDAAIAAARAVGYEGAGTVEFIVDQSGPFYFMEMNTRLQVEHPVTEMITGLDLVEWQLRVAAGEGLPLAQKSITVEGHAIEARLYAEDPARDFLPQTGTLVHLRLPEQNGHVRIDSGVREGDAISIHYDPMIGKLIVWDIDRDAAVRRLQAALAQTEIAGLTTNVPFLAAVAGHRAFAAAEIDTGFIPRYRDELIRPHARPSDRALAFASLAVLLDHQDAARAAAAASADRSSPWSQVSGWRLNDDAFHVLRWREPGGDAGSEIAVTAHFRRGGFVLDLPGGALAVRGTRDAAGRIAADLGGTRGEATVVRRGAELTVLDQGRAHLLALFDPLVEAAGAEAGAGRLTAPMPGKIVAVRVKPGEAVKRGQALVTLEAMKMEHTIAAPADGVVAAVRFQPGEQVEEGAELVALEEG
jgi:3-methylcrotonyl-CoA carboxylase alpha subunit